MYLTYTLTIIFQQHSNVRNAFPIHPLAHNLDNTQNTLLSWIPLFTSLSSKHLDTIHARAYICLTKFYTAYLSSSPTEAFAQEICHSRAYTLFACTLCNVWRIALTASSPHNNMGASRPLGRVYAKSLIPSRSGPSSCSDIWAYSKLVDDMCTINAGPKDNMFVPFSELWMTFARRVG